jgi:hypothetical protein
MASATGMASAMGQASAMGPALAKASGPTSQAMVKMSRRRTR